MSTRSTVRSKTENALKRSWRETGSRGHRSWRKVAEHYGLKSAAQAWNIAHGRQAPPPDLILRLQLQPAPKRRRIFHLHELPTAEIARRLRERFVYASTDEQRASVEALVQKRQKQKRNLKQYHQKGIYDG